MEEVEDVATCSRHGVGVRGSDAVEVRVVLTTPWPDNLVYAKKLQSSVPPWPLSLEPLSESDKEWAARSRATLGRREHLSEGEPTVPAAVMGAFERCRRQVRRRPVLGQHGGYPFRPDRLQIY